MPLFSAGPKASSRHVFALTTICAGVIGVDQLTKLLVTHTLRLGEMHSIIPGFFDLTYIRNTGAAFGLLAQMDPAFRGPFFVLVPLLALASIIWVFRKIPAGNHLVSIALALVAGGAAGNLIDRAVFGSVVDFLMFHWTYEYQFPAFNVADTSVCIGVGLLLLDTLYRDKSKAPQA